MGLKQTMSLSSSLASLWSIGARRFDEGIAALPGIGQWFRPSWNILIVHRDGQFTVPDATGKETPLDEEALRSFAQQKRICLRLGPGLGQQRDIVLPPAAHHDPGAMIALSLKQYFPFPEEDTIFAVHGLADPQGQDPNRYRVSFARRSLVEEIEHRAAQLGIKPKATDAMGDDPLAPVTADLISGDKAGGGKSASTVLVGLCIAFLAITLGISAWSALTLSPKAEALQIRQQPDATDQAVLQKQAKDSAPSILDIWQAATRALPDNAHAQYLLYEKGRLRIAGMAKDAAMLVNAIESQPLFSETSFAAASLKEEDGQESFDLVTRVREGKAP
jgi:Fimbrial assembly protein (PilN)